jgi:hypothetical protein
MSRSASEPDSASLCKVGAASLLPPCGMMKPDTSGEVMGASSRRALRGGWGRRRGIDQSIPLGAGWEARRSAG